MTNIYIYNVNKKFQKNKFRKKNIQQKKTYIDQQPVWVIRIDDPYEIFPVKCCFSLLHCFKQQHQTNINNIQKIIIIHSKKATTTTTKE